MNAQQRIALRAGCLFAAVPAITFLAFGRPVDGNYIGYLGVSLPALACFAGLGGQTSTSLRVTVDIQVRESAAALSVH